MTSGAGPGRAGGAGHGDLVLPRELPALRKDWPKEALEDWAERAAILEYDARMHRDRAERSAEQYVRDQWSKSKS